MSCENGIPYGEGPVTDAVSALITEIKNKNYEAKNVNSDVVDRAKGVIDFMLDKGYPIEVGISFAGVWAAESRIETWSYNKSEQSNGFAFRNVTRDKAESFVIAGETYYKDQAGMMSFGYGKGMAQWSWDRNIKFREWYNSGAEGHKTSGLPTMDHFAANITATTVDTQTAYAWYEMRHRTGEFMGVLNSLKSSPATTEEEFNVNVTRGVDAVLRGFENGGPSKMASTSQIDKYKWCNGYEGAMKTRMENALGIAQAVKNDYPQLSYLS